MKQEDIIRMAREADPKANLSEPYCLDHETRAWLEAFAALVAAAATEAANARANTSWALMCKKMVAAENEACAKVCESYLSESPHSWGGTTMAADIRARGQA
jgi:hypothetical protein